MKKNRLKILMRILRNTGADRLLLSYMVFVLAAAAVIWITEPTIKTFRGALWYCYAVISTAGFGDVVATAFVPKVVSVALTVYSVLAIAIVTGVVVNYYTHMTELKNKETLAAFIDRLEELPELSKEELEELSGRVREFRMNDKGTGL
ncbi:MAG: potassium channel family protein [Lachnospiraceae bacterium]|nr:potassium channel family protein [Lachnospiraceae bacterium]